MIRKLAVIFLLAFCSFALKQIQAQKNDAELAIVSEYVQDYLLIKYPEVELDTFIYVGVQRQMMYLFMDGEVEKVYDVSTSKHGAGAQYGSNCTPVGLHCVDGKFGNGVPKGGVLVGRKYTGRIAQICEDPLPSGRDDITSRVITIRGLEEGVNKGGKIDTYQRRIYIHGTAEEGLIGQPASHGCIRMRNDDVIELFSIVDEGLPILILDN